MRGSSWAHSPALCGSCRHVGAREGPIPVLGPMGVLSSMWGSMEGPVTCVGAHGGRNTRGGPRGGPVTVWGTTRGGPIAMWVSMGSLSPIWVPLRVLTPVWVPVWGPVAHVGPRGHPVLGPAGDLTGDMSPPSLCPYSGVFLVPLSMSWCWSLSPHCLAVFSCVSPLPGAGGGAEVLGTVAGGLGAGGCGPCLH